MTTEEIERADMLDRQYNDIVYHWCYGDRARAIDIVNGLNVQDTEQIAVYIASSDLVEAIIQRDNGHIASLQSLLHRMVRTMKQLES